MSGLTPRSPSFLPLSPFLPLGFLTQKHAVGVEGQALKAVGDRRVHHMGQTLPGGGVVEGPRFIPGGTEEAKEKGWEMGEGEDEGKGRDGEKGTRHTGENRNRA